MNILLNIVIKLGGAVFLCFLLLVGAFVALGSQLPTDELAFDSPREGSHDIYLLDVGRGITARLTRSAANEHSPAWSPDGDYLAYISESATDRAVYVMSATGRSPYRLTGVTLLGTNPALAWSPDGLTLALTSTDDSSTQGVFLIGSDGSNLRRVSGVTGNAFTPTWSREGTEIAFSWSPVANTEIWVMNLNQPENPSRITNHPLTDTAPAWSPDGGEIAFYSDRDGSSDIYLMNPDGSNLRAITNDPARNTMPTWSPDSQRLAFVSNRAGSNNIFIMRRDGGGIRQVTFDHADATRPAWRP